MKGGARPGAGRKKGSKNLRRFQDYWTEAEVKQFVEAGKDRYMDSDKLYIEFVQQIFGKAPQPLTGADGEKLFPTPLYGGKSVQVQVQGHDRDPKDIPAA